MGYNDIGIKEFGYMYKFQTDELSDHICSLPYTFLEKIIKDILADEDFLLDLLDEIVEKLRSDKQLNSRRALRKIYTVCKTLDVGYFDLESLEPFNYIEPPRIIKNLIDGGQLEPEPINGKYKPYKSMPDFISWCCQNGYEDDISAEFIFKNIVFRGNSIRSIKIYINNAKER